MAWKHRSMVVRRPPILLLSIFLSIFYLLAIPTLALAKVKGVCVNCHTMHNSQGGTEPAKVGGTTGLVGWNGATLELSVAQGTASTAPVGNLLKTDCVGCHSATTADTIITIGENRIPIVYNIVAPQYANSGSPSNALAGGNFYWVAHATSGDKSVKDQKGHNVFGISTGDTHLKKAPGGTVGCSGTGCHYSLVVPKTSENTGCQGCHYHVFHHEDNGHYRFLNSHEHVPGSGTPNFVGVVVGHEDADWEQTVNSSKHNEYKGDTKSGSLKSTNSMTAYCVGCHDEFHKQKSGGAWVRHPSDAVLPGDTPNTEYEYYNNRVSTGVYNPLAPVARESVSSVSSTVTIDSDMVMCLSCHRPHGSPYADILRWPYNPDIDQIGGAFPFDKYASGCVICHTQKIPYSP